MRVYCPSLKGHARDMAARLIDLSGCGAEWFDQPEQVDGFNSGLLYLAEIKYTEALSDAVSGFDGRVVAQLMHAVPHHCSPTRMQALLRLYHRADTLLVPHDGIAEQLSAMGVEKSKITILNSYPYHKFHRPALRRGRGKRLLLALGFHGRDSGVDRLAELSGCFGSDAGFTIIVAGKMDRSDELRLRRQGCKVFNRFLDERRMQKWLLRGDYLLMPYRKRVESPLVNRAIEAGIPVIRTPDVTDWNGCSEFDGEQLAWDVTDWHAAIKHALRAGARATTNRNIWIGNELLSIQMQSLLRIQWPGIKGVADESVIA